MAFAKFAIDEICGFKSEDKESVNKWCNMSTSQVARRTAKAAGATTAQLLATEDNTQQLLELTACFIVHDICQSMQSSRLKYQKMYAALWTFLLPEQNRRRMHRVDEWWSLQVCIGIAISMQATSDWKSKPYLRNVLRILPREVQKAYFEERFDMDAVVRFTWNNLRLLLGHVQTEAVLYIGLHARTKAWYVGRTQQNRYKGPHVWKGPTLRWQEHFKVTVVEDLVRYNSWCWQCMQQQYENNATTWMVTYPFEEVVRADGRAIRRKVW